MYFINHIQCRIYNNETNFDKTRSASPAKAALLLQGMSTRWNDGEARTFCREA